MRQDYLAEDNAIAREFFNLLSSDARNALTVEDICVLVGLAAGSRERAVRAELTAPAGGDREAADKIGTEAIDIVEEFMKDNIDRATAGNRIGDIIRDALRAARQAERSKVPPPDEIHRDGYNEGVMAERERWEAAAREVLQKVNLIEYCDTATKEDVDEYREARDTLAALVRCEKEVESGE